jgi:hypothetical protein
MRGAQCLLFVALLCGCTQTTIEGYADRPVTARTLSHIVAYVAGPAALANEAQRGLTAEAGRHGVTLDNAFYILPPTRAYADADIKRELATRGVDGVLLIRIGRTGIIREYAGTLFAGLESVSARGDSDFVARLADPANGQALWSGAGRVTVSGLLILGNRSGPSSVAAAILDELKAKGLLRN